MKRRQQFADSAPPARSRGRGRSANGGLRGASRSPARTGADTSGFEHSAKKTTTTTASRKRRNQPQSHTSTPFRPQDQNYSRRSAGEERPTAAYMEDPTMRVGADILETLGKDERDICLLMVDMLSRQSHVTALRIIGSLHQRLDVKRYLDLYGGTYEHTVTPENVKDLDGRRELMEHLMAAQQALAEARRPEAEAREAARAEFLSSNSPVSRSGTKPNQTGSKVIRKTPAPPRSPAKKEAPRSNLPPSLRHMSYSVTDTAFSSESSPGAYSNATPMNNHPPPPVSVPAASLWSSQPSTAVAPPAAASAAPPAAVSSSPPPPVAPPKAPETQPHLGNAYAAAAPPANNNIAKYSTLGGSEDDAPEEDWMHESPSVGNSPENVASSSKKPDDYLAKEHIGQQLSWESPATHERDEGVMIDRDDEDEGKEPHSASETDEDYYKKPGNGDDEDEEEEIDDIEDEEEEVVDQSDGENAGEDEKKQGGSAFPWDDI